MERTILADITSANNNNKDTDMSEKVVTKRNGD
jgi:hypothetical protein